jgi:hypothetical protein
MSTQERNSSDATAPADDGITQRLELVVAMVERLRGTAPTAGDNGVAARLARAGELLDALESFMPEVRDAAKSGRWDACDAVTARLAFDVYDRALRELRAVAVDARGGIERAAAAFSDAQTFARRRGRRADKIAAKGKGD